MGGQASTGTRPISPWPNSPSGPRTGERSPPRRAAAGALRAGGGDLDPARCPPAPCPPPPAPPRAPAGRNAAGRRAGCGRATPPTDARGGVRRGQGADLRVRLLGGGAKRPAGGGDRGLRSLRGRARPVCPRGRSPRVPRDRRVERDREPVARALRRPVG